VSITIDTVYVKTYENTVRHLAQQGVTRLRPWVMEKSVQSEAHNWDTMNSVDAERKSSRGTAGRRADTPENDSNWGRRQTQNDVWDVGDTVEQDDIVQMLVDPSSNIAMSHGMALRRAFDDDIITAATGQSRLEDGTLIDFCTRCKKCADACPSKAIPFGTKTDVDGVLRWKIDSEACFTYWCIIGTDCGRCVSVCPYSHPRNFMHNVVRFGVRNNSLFRRLAVTLDDFFYGEKPAPLPLPAWMDVQEDKEDRDGKE